ncbi:MAG TPA: class I SAM-dependent methyltransferase, partial [Candidatus Dormibacteraeota bacterium]|nr:class I SAM-dependent methyltransferase [Candidatus Dormibacteraeota bacterium]
MLLRVQSRATCILCGSSGELLYEGLEDPLYGVAGQWSYRRCSNSSCRLLWLDPAPIEEDIGAAYAQYFTHEAAADSPSLPRRVYRRVRSSYLRSRFGYGGTGSRALGLLGRLHPGSGDVFASSVMFLPAPSNGASLLDVGAGGGDFVASLGALGWKASGVETDPVAAQRARARGLDVHQGDLESAGFADASFDAITLAHVIEHVPDATRMLTECRRLLKPTGRLVLLTPNTASWGHRRYGRDWLYLDPPRHLHLFNPTNMRRLLADAGLTPLRIATMAINASAVLPTSAAIRRARSKRTGSVRLQATPGGVASQLVERLRLRIDPDAGEDLL